VVAGADWRVDHPSPYGWLSDLSWSRDGKALAFMISFDGFASQLWVAEWTGGPAQLFNIPIDGKATISGTIKWRGDSRNLTYLADDQARARIFEVRDVKNGRFGNSGTLTGGDVVVTDYGWDWKGDKAIVGADLLDDTGNLFNLEKGSLKRLTNINPMMDSWILPQIEIVKWTGADGDPVEGILELPAGYNRETDGPLPMIVELHGGPTADTKYRFRLWIYGRALMPANGYAVFSPNYHGSTGFGDTFLAKLIGRENEIEVTDIATGVEHLIQSGLADKDLLGIMGWSNGGYLTNCMITHYPDMFKAASSGAGVLDMALQWSIEDTPGHVINFVQGLPWEQQKHYQDASPLYMLDKVKTPTLIHVGGNDPRVPPAHSRALYRALYHYLDVPVELVVYPNEPHGLTTHNNRLAKMEWDLAWFEKYLLGVEDGDGE
jgi:acylaminoacyl-peptidase